MSRATPAGFDGVLVARLKPVHRKVFFALELSSLGAAVVLGAGVRYAARLADLGAWPSAGLGVLFALFSLNLTRLWHAGGGYPLHRPRTGIAQWRPSRVWLAFAVAWALLASQPLVAWVLHNQVEAHVDRLRAEHRALQQAALPAERTPLGDRDEAAGERRSNAGVPAADSPDAGSGFVAARIRAVWDSPLAATLLTLLFTALGASPALLRQWRVDAVRAYERRRRDEERPGIKRAHVDARRALEATLSRRWAPAFHGLPEELYFDAPFNTKLRKKAWLRGELKRNAVDELLSLLR
jgi:hypothetical protein